MTWVMSNLISVRLEKVLVSVQDRWTVCVKHSIGLVIVLDTPVGRPSDKAQGKLVSVCLEIVLILTQDWCVVYAEYTIGSEIILDTPN
jgi:hypothetical protein